MIKYPTNKLDVKMEDKIIFRHAGAVHCGVVRQIRSRGFGVKLSNGKLWNVPVSAVLRVE